MKNATAYYENTNYFVIIKQSEALIRSSLCLSLTFFTVETLQCRFNDFNVIVLSAYDKPEGTITSL